MEKEFLTGVAAPSVVIQACSHDLVIDGWTEPRVILESETDPRVELQDEKIVVVAEEDLRVHVPSAASIEITEAGGDVVVREVKSTVSIRRCGGDLLVRHCERANLGSISGDLRARDVLGGLKAEKVGGDARLSQVADTVEIAAGGDVRIENPVAQALVQAHGDAAVAILPKPGTESRISAGGDLRVFLPAEVSVVLDGKAVGNTVIRYVSGKDPQASVVSGPLPVTIGKGEARLTLDAGGDLWIGGWMDADAWGDWRELGRDMGQLGMEFGMLAGEFGRWVESNMREKFSEYDRRLRQKIDESRARRGYGWSGNPPRPPSATGAGENERLSILQMLQQGKITVDEAERLFAALEKK
jgi:SHOCT-like domain